MGLSLAPGVHNNSTVPEQVRELNVAVKEVGGDGGSKEMIVRKLKYISVCMW